MSSDYSIAGSMFVAAIAIIAIIVVAMLAINFLQSQEADDASVRIPSDIQIDIPGTNGGNASQPSY